MIYKSFVLTALVIVLTTNLYTGDRSNARSTAMAFTTLVSSAGNDAYGINPANYDFHKPLTLSKTDTKLKKKKSNFVPNWEFTIFSAGGGYGSDSSIEFYNDYLKYLSIDRNKFVDLFTDFNKVLEFRQDILPGDKTDVNYDFELNWLSVNYRINNAGSVNFSISDRVGLNTNVNSRDEYLPLNFSLTFNPNGSYNLTNVNLSQSEAIAWWIRKYNISYAKQFDFKGKKGIKSFSFGFSAALVHGFGNVSTYESKLAISTYGVQSINGTNHVDSIKGKQDFHTQSALTDLFRDYNDGAKTQFSLFPNPAGTGYSFDFGINMQLGSEWRLAASVTDLGKITWDYNTITNNDTNSFAYYNFNMNVSDPTYNALVDDLGGYNTQDTNTKFSSDMPTKFRAGLLYQPSEKFMVEFNWTKGTNNLPGNTSDAIISLGSEYYATSFLPVRAGVSIGGPGAFYISLGAGIKFRNFTIDVGTHGINQLFLDRRFSVAVTSRIIL